MRGPEVKDQYIVKFDEDGSFWAVRKAQLIKTEPRKRKPKAKAKG